MTLRIANCSGFLGDRRTAAREMVDGGPIDYLTGDWLGAWVGNTPGEVCGPVPGVRDHEV